MSVQTSGWKSAFLAFLDRRALIMLFLGFSAGIPILLIFSSLSLWLGEAGISKSAVTFFSWAALGYSFKFVWAPLIDELPVPFFTKMLGRRRAWLLIAQILIICAICIMAFSDPALGKTHLYQMAAGAVLLGFSAATQDIVIDAYRIELAETQMQTVLASTYNAGYRIGMIIAGAGALFLAAKLGTAKGNYIYDAWKYTYLAMAAVMLVGIMTTLFIREPQVDRVRKQYKRTDYYRLVGVFFIAVSSFVLSYLVSGGLITSIIAQFTIEDSLALFSLEAARFITSGAVAFGMGAVLVSQGAVNRQMAYETWVNPVADFFDRYGLKLALVLLLLIGFYRISDIIAGVISNVFYQDLNFSKEQIAEAVKVYGVIFSLLGGFLGGLLAQRFNIMKLMFIGAVLASSTNLIFVGLVKSGQQLSDVSIQIGQSEFRVQSDEVGYFKLNVPADVLNQADKIIVQSHFIHSDQNATTVDLPYLKTNDQPQVLFLPLSQDNQLRASELKQSVVVKSQLSGINLEQIDRNKSFYFVLDGKDYPVKIDDQGLMTGTIAGQDLATAKQKTIRLRSDDATLNAIIAELSLSYKIDLSTHVIPLSIDVDPIPVIDTNSQQMVELKGKVIKEYSTNWLYFAIVVDNLASGLAGAAFIAFLSSLTSVSFTAVQYAIFSSLMTLTPKILGGYSGTIVTNIGYPNFFLMTTLIGIPILILVVWVGVLLSDHQKQIVNKDE